MWMILKKLHAVQFGPIFYMFSWPNMVHEILKQFTYIHVHCTNVCVFTDEYIIDVWISNIFRFIFQNNKSVM